MDADYKQNGIFMKLHQTAPMPSLYGTSRLSSPPATVSVTAVMPHAAERLRGLAVQVSLWFYSFVRRPGERGRGGNPRRGAARNATGAGASRSGAAGSGSGRSGVSGFGSGRSSLGGSGASHSASGHSGSGMPPSNGNSFSGGKGGKRYTRVGMADFLVLAILLLAPAFALDGVCRQQGIAIGVPAAIAAVLSLIAFVFMVLDKKSAETNQWRTPERFLHLLEWLGGWPGSFLAQRIYWHKVSKTSYQTIFWLVVIVYQFISIDYLLDWKWLRWLGTQL